MSCVGVSVGAKITVGSASVGAGVGLKPMPGPFGGVEVASSAAPAVWKQPDAVKAIRMRLAVSPRDAI